MQATFVVAHPLTIEEKQVRKDSQGNYLNVLGADGPLRDVAVLASTALAADEVALGDSRIGAALGVRSPVSAVVGQEQDDMSTNRVTVLVKGRWAPLVGVPAAFAHYTIPPRRR